MSASSSTGHDDLVEQFAALWDQGQSPPDVVEFLQQHRALTPHDQLDILMFDQGRRWRSGECRPVEDYCAQFPPINEDSSLKLKLVVEEFGYRLDRGEDPTVDSLVQRFPDLDSEQLRRCLEDLKAGGADDVASTRMVGSQERLQADEAPASGAASSRGESPDASSSLQTQPETIGRYRVTRVLGQGDFGCVYLAFDDELKRSVAIKVPHRRRIKRRRDVEAYLEEARVVASLDHPGIVPVYDVGSTEDGLFYVVSKFVEGADLARRIKENRPSHAQAAAMVADIADALYFAHQKELVHRDIKPANLLIDNDDKVYLADFGLALTHEGYGSGSELVGSPAYMSPEQARRESHLVDGRSDIFSLGTVLYELLTGKRPFTGARASEVLRNISATNARPPRQRDASIPRELERICLKALSKRATDRYTNALDMATDLRCFLAQAAFVGGGSDGSGSAPQTASETVVDRPVKIVPKGLRSFDAKDSSFFLHLVPGPVDREGLPDSIRFWKDRVEDDDAETVFRVGLIYGPSGCGKSSLVKAGLLPRLSDQVSTVYVEATGQDTEHRLLRGLHRKYAALPSGVELPEALEMLRGEDVLPEGQKVLIILDQFEQWLHANPSPQDALLVEALRQCDGVRTQCLLMVRDDFWLAVSRFLAELEVELIQGSNIHLIDLFDPLHARKVLEEFGRAYQRISDDPQQMSAEQGRFLDEAVQGLAREGKVVPVRLALFAEMMKGKPWTPAVLKSIGGAKGVGATFLEETFSASTAHPTHRLHQRAAREVLAALLPVAGLDIRGKMRSFEELMRCSGYSGRNKDFLSLLRILDSELRLISPTDPAGTDAANEAVPTAAAQQRYYQLTHDYLVPSLRDWLTRKQRETARGRAALRLAERASIWSTRPENRHLPSLAEYAKISTLTSRRNWSQAQRSMMRAAGKFYAFRGLAVLILAAFLTWGLWEGYGAMRARELVRGVQDAEPTSVPRLIADISPYRRWADPRLKAALSELEATRKDLEKNDVEPSSRKYAEAQRKSLHVSLALLPVDDGPFEGLFDRLLKADAEQVALIGNAFKSQLSHLDELPHDLRNRLWKVVESADEAAGPARLRAACALALLGVETRVDGASPWSRVSDDVARQLVAQGHMVTDWQRLLQPIAPELARSLAGACRDSKLNYVQRTLAADVLTHYADQSPDQPLFSAVVAEAIQYADEEQFGTFVSFLTRRRSQASVLLKAFLEENADQQTDQEADKESLALRTANAAAALLRLGGADAVLWRMLSHRPDPRVRSYLIHRVQPCGVDPQVLINQFSNEPDPFSQEADPSIKGALALCLGEYDKSQISPASLQRLRLLMTDVHQNHPDAGLHGAVEWLLRRWWTDEEMEAAKLEMNETIQRPRPAGGEHLTGKERRWEDVANRHTMVLIGPGQFQAGSPPSEKGHVNDELAHLVVIDHATQVDSTEVTRGQYKNFLKAKEEKGESFRNFLENDEIKRFADPRVPDRSPVLGITFFEAAAYCNWMSELAGIDREQWCFAPNSEGKYQAEMRIRPDYHRRVGFRLLLGEEWEYACRAGTTTSFNFGESDALLRHFAMFARAGEERVLPVGSLKPNAWGLSDMHGNVAERCRDAFHAGYLSPDELVAGEVVYDRQEPNHLRVLRGGSFLSFPRDVRSAVREAVPVGVRGVGWGFRIARTVWPDASAEVPLILAGDRWKFDDSGRDLKREWVEQGYDDSPWRGGEGPLGYGDPQRQTMQIEKVYPTAYFRKEFNVENKSDLASLRLEIMCDDGAAVYLNGKYLGNLNLDPLPDFDDWAKTAVDGRDERTFHPIEVDDVSLLKDEGNVLAVEVHQAYSTSSDLNFDLRLWGVRKNLAKRRPSN